MTISIQKISIVSLFGIFSVGMAQAGGMGAVQTGFDWSSIESDFYLSSDAQIVPLKVEGAKNQFSEPVYNLCRQGDIVRTIAPKTIFTRFTDDCSHGVAYCEKVPVLSSAIQVYPSAPIAGSVPGNCVEWKDVSVDGYGHRQVCAAYAAHDVIVDGAFTVYNNLRGRNYYEAGKAEYKSVKGVYAFQMKDCE